MAERGKCDNCERDNLYIVAHGICGACYGAVRQCGWGTPECEAALAEAKKRFTDPNYKRGGKKKIAPAKKATGKKTGISKVTATDAAIIEHLKEQRDEHLATAKKLDQAIECLS